MARETGCDARCGSVPHTQYCCHGHWELVNKWGSRAISGARRSAHNPVQGEREQVLQERVRHGVSRQTHADLCTRITRIHIHMKATQDPKPRSGETYLQFSLFPNPNTKLTSSKKKFPVASLLRLPCPPVGAQLPLHWWLFSQMHTPLPSPQPPLPYPLTHIKRRCFRSHVPKGMVTQKPVKRRSHWRRQDENLWRQTTILWS